LAWFGLAALALTTLAACSPSATLNALTARDTHTLVAGLPYGADPRQRLDVYRPAQAAPPGGWPVVVFFYGGSWNSGERGNYRFVGEALAARGILVVVPDYRLYPQVRYPDFLYDSAAALAYAMKEASALGGNPARLFVMGHSAGGYNAAMLALDGRWLAAQGQSPTELAGWVGLAGPYDFLPIVNPEVKPVFHHPDYPPGTQPIAFAGPRSPPAFLAAPRHDDLVNPERNTEAMAARLRAAGVPVELRRYDRVNHQVLIGTFAWPLRWLAPALDDVAGFLSKPPKNSP
jgi:acetyl esterase/lipase